MNKDLFETRVKLYEEQILVYQKQYNRIANIRLVVLLFGIYMGYLISAAQNKLLAAMGLMGCIGIFLYLVYQHGKIKEKKDEAIRLKEVNEKYLMRQGQGWEAFEDLGEDFVDKEHPYGFDLDIVGKGSLFQKISIARTWHGRKRLAEVLLNPSFSEDEIMARQQSIKELSHKLDFCQSLEAVVSKKQDNEKQVTTLINFVKGDWQSLKLTQMGWLVYSLPWVFISWGIVAYVSGNKLLIGTWAIMIIVSCCVQLLLGYKIAEVKSILMSIGYSIKTYEQVLKLILKEEFKSPYLKSCLNTFQTTSGSALDGIKEIEKISQSIQITYQPIVALPLNAIWFWDFKTLLKFEKWCKDYGQYFKMWLEAIGELEALVSLSVLAHVDKVAFPLIIKEEKISAEQLAHPLLQSKDRVSNSIVMERECLIITGSNMSGKTTFLRTMGINLVLAYTGAPVMAQTMTCGVMPIYTSMRITDDLSGGVSTFYAELKRIKQMIEASKKHKIIFLVDEIFRGTNSKDRIIGAKSVLKGLVAHGAIGAITTHDLELCQLGEEEHILNYHFTEYYEEEGIHFDYKIKKGPSTTTNAKYLMALVGIQLMEC